jgi:hypothetical protein
MKRTYILGLLCCGLFLGYTTTPAPKEKWQVLFNGKNLKGWDTYLGRETDDNGRDLNGGIPVGFNTDPKKVFTVVKEDGKPAIRISGETWGALISQQEFENYHLRLQFKWGKVLWGHKKKANIRGSGVLYHSVGPHGADWGFWMRSQEFQVEEGRSGDYWGCAGGSADIPAAKVGNDYFYSPRGTMTTFSEGNKQGRHCKKQGQSKEKPVGEWNTLDLYCHGDTSIHVVNGKVAMVLYHNSQNDNGKFTPLVKGKIQFESEGAELFYREVMVQGIGQLPVGLLME